MNNYETNHPFFIRSYVDDNYEDGDPLHCFLHSGKHSARDFCSDPFGLVHSYRHLLRHASLTGAAAHAAGTGDFDPEVRIAPADPESRPPATTDRKRCRD